MSPLWAETRTTATPKPAPQTAPKASYIVRPSTQTIKRREAVVGMWDDASKGPQLLEALSDKDVVTRAAAARGLGTIKFSGAREKLISVLGADSSAEVREAAALSLQQLNDPSVTPALTKAIADPVTSVRTTALMGIGHYRDRSARIQVEAAAKDSSPDIRRTALYTLSRLGDVQSAPVVEEMLKDPDYSVKAMAAQTLGDIRATGSKAALTGLLQDASKPVQISAARSLLKLGDSAGFEKAKAYALDDDMTVRLLAIDALGWSKDPEAGKVLADILDKVPANNRHAVQESQTRHERLRKQK